MQSDPPKHYRISESPNPDFWRNRRVCVTGGTGFLGYHLGVQLAALGARVRSFALPAAPPDSPLPAESMEHCFGDILDAGQVRDAISGAELVFHTAGAVATWGAALRNLEAVHTLGTAHVLAAAGPGVRIVHTSSVVAVGAGEGEILTEEAFWNLASIGVDYVVAKRRAEEAALDAARDGRDVVVVNPAYLVGPSDYGPSVMGRFLLRCWTGRVPLALPGGINLVDVRDVATGHLLAAEHGRSGRRYILGGSDTPFRDLLLLTASVAGLRFSRIQTLAPGAEWLLAALAESWARVSGREPYPSLQHYRMNRYSWYYDSSRAHDELGFRARPLAESLEDTYAWFAKRRPLRPTAVSRFWLRPRNR